MRSVGRLARALVRLYPRAWRARYEDEMLALIEQSPATLATIADLAAGMLREWLRAALRPSAPPTDLKAARRRDQLVASIRLATVAVVSVLLGHRLAASGLAGENSGVRFIVLAPFVLAMWRSARVEWQRQKLVKQAADRSEPVSTAAVVELGIGRVEYWIGLTAVVANFSMILAIGGTGLTFARLINVVSLAVCLRQMSSITRGALQRRCQLLQLDGGRVVS